MDIYVLKSLFDHASNISDILHKLGVCQRRNLWLAIFVKDNIEFCDAYRF